MGAEQMQTMQLVEKHTIRRGDKRFAVLDTAAFHAKNIYNAATYQRRQAFIHDGRSLTYEDQEKGFKKRHLLPDQQLPMKVVQQVLRGVDSD
jgi:putative transposase